MLGLSLDDEDGVPRGIGVSKDKDAMSTLEGYLMGGGEQILI